ncbi:carbohydrate-binding module family 50 protein [Poronia punctata]|nr:carbohydrate-binding module family 50 protein [Poronia punctata]
MARWSEYDTDEERLPEGMKRIGYDADTQTYTFRDAEGHLWESAPGNRYGELRRVATTSTLPSYGEDDGDSSPNAPLASYPGPSASYGQPSWRAEMMPLLNWFLIVGLFLIALLWFISRSPKSSTEVVQSCSDATTRLKIRPGDTCWAIAEERSISLDALLSENKGLDCDKLSVGETVCVPKT